MRIAKGMDIEIVQVSGGRRQNRSASDNMAESESYASRSVEEADDSWMNHDEDETGGASISCPSGLRDDEKWSRREVFQLIDIWRQLIHELEGTHQKREHYERIAQELGALGYKRRHSTIIQKKIQNLRDVFRKVSIKCFRRNIEPKWLFYQALSEFLTPNIAAATFKRLSTATAQSGEDEHEETDQNQEEDDCPVYEAPPTFVSSIQTNLPTLKRGVAPQEDQEVDLSDVMGRRAIHGQVLSLLNQLANQEAQFSNDMMQLQKTTAENFTRLRMKITDLVEKIVEQMPPPQITASTQKKVRYDKPANGHYH